MACGSGPNGNPIPDVHDGVFIMDQILIIAMEWVALNIVPVKTFIVNTMKINYRYPIRTDFIGKCPENRIHCELLDPAVQRMWRQLSDIATSFATSIPL
ncbi:hypothetical protein FOQG_17234 [Fusarium oxysporum f. sp. raphani 54005]|uniref:Uncharacterized protein n=1 Tax=Fusarium oxysporum f. sp. raphani 54005 TaxID=1089458 RepID=X0C5R4_FUSOX|nr:hypothetical protein FOQG_17234 [Fusarium oxysporum f. sp. raphani 54005]